MTAAYVESSALVKLVCAEPETEVLRRALASDGALVTSDLAVIEVSRTAARVDADEGLARARAVFLRLHLLPIDGAVVELAATLSPPSLRSLDAIHVASARVIGDPDVVFYSYDDRSVAAAHACGLLTRSPRADA